MERLDKLDKPNRKPNFTLSDDVDIDKLFRDGGTYRFDEGVDFEGSADAVGKYILAEFRARYGNCVVPKKDVAPGTTVVKITPPSLP